MFKRTAQGLDRTPAELESQLDPGTEAQCAGPCPISGIVKDQGWGEPRRGGKEMPLKQTNGDVGVGGIRGQCSF